MMHLSRFMAFGLMLLALGGCKGEASPARETADATATAAVDHNHKHEVVPPTDPPEQAAPPVPPEDPALEVRWKNRTLRAWTNDLNDFDPVTRRNAVTAVIGCGREARHVLGELRAAFATERSEEITMSLTIALANAGADPSEYQEFVLTGLGAPERALEDSYRVDDYLILCSDLGSEARFAAPRIQAIDAIVKPLLDEEERLQAEINDALGRRDAGVALAWMDDLRRLEREKPMYAARRLRYSIELAIERTQ